MKPLTAFGSSLPLLLLALIPAACAGGSIDETTLDDPSSSRKQSLTERLQQHSLAPVEVLAHHDRATARVAMGQFAVSDLGTRAGAPVEEKARAFLGRHGDVFGPRDTARELTTIEENTDELGIHHLTFGQMYEGIEVYNSIVKVHLSADGQHIEYVNSDFVPGVHLSTTTPAIDGERAIHAARGRMRSGKLSAAPKLFIYAGSERAEMSPRLVWVVDLTSQRSINTVRYFVDAESGSVVDHVSLTPSLQIQETEEDRSGDHEISEQPYPLLDELEAIEADSGQPDLPHVKKLLGRMTRVTYDALNKDSLPGTLLCRNGICNGPSGEAANLDARTNTTMNTFYNTFGRASYGGGLRGPYSVVSSARYKNPEGPNAYWDGNNKRFVYSPGLATLDIVAHEYTHAVTQYSADLTYYRESGALNESFSDIFGTYVNSESQGKDIWKIGADLPSSLKGPCGATRDISNPTSCATSSNPSPKTTANWVNTCRDQGGVHINSGIVAYAYYRLASGIGRDKAAQIFYRALTKYLTSNSKLEAARTAVKKAANDLYCKKTWNPPQTVCQKAGSKAVVDYVDPAFAAAGLDGTWTAPSIDCSSKAKESDPPQALPDLAEYKGCYTDDYSLSPGRALPHKLMDNNATVGSCTAAAKAAGYKYAGLQYHYECWAGNTLGYTKVSDSECKYACDAASAETCGGDLRNSVWQVKF